MSDNPRIEKMAWVIGPHPCHRKGCDGTCRFIEDEYGSLASGGSYEKWKCDKCGRVTWIPLPD